MAEQTALQESAQALFCAMADILGKGKSNEILKPITVNKDGAPYPTYKDFKKGNKRLIADALKGITVKEKGSRISLKQMEDFLTSNGKAEFGKKTNDWYISSVLIANLIVNKLTTIDPQFGIASANFQDIYYFRGDEKIMGNIQKLFTIANENTEWRKLTREVQFGDVNKWNPADIYLASVKGKNNAEKVIENELSLAKDNGGKEYTFLELNELIRELIDSGDLLPLSLKKGEGTVKLVPVNFDTGFKRDLLARITYDHYRHGTVKNKWTKYKKVPTDIYGIPTEEAETRDFQIMLKLPDLCELKLRHDPSGGRLGSFKITVMGGSARGGSIGSVNIFCQIIKFVDKKFSIAFENAFDNGRKAFALEMEKRKFYKGQTGRIAVEKLGSKSKVLKGDKGASRAFNHARGEISALKLINPIIGGTTGFQGMAKWLDNLEKRKRNKLAKHLYKYITARSKKSGQFVIAKSG